MLARRCLLCCAFVCAMWVSAPLTASARRDATFAYPFSRVWTAAVRLVRVDLECPVTEKDKEDGYFFFDYTDRGKSFPGSVEFVGLDDRVRVIVQVPAMPAYVEAMILDRLGRKLEQEFGPPAVAPGPKKPGKPEAEEPPEGDGEQPAPPPGDKRPAAR